MEPKNAHNLTGARYEGLKEYTRLMKEFDVRHDIIGKIYDLLPYITFTFQDWVAERLK